MLSPAALNSDWVFQEASALQVRKSAEGESFSLIPVLLAGATRNALKSSKLASLGLEASHMPSKTIGSNEIVELLAPVMERHGPKRPLYLLETAIADLFQGLSENSLQIAAEALGLDLGQWVPEGKPLALARRMLQAKLALFEKAVLQIRVQLGPRVLTIVDIVLPFTWINAQAVAPLSEVASSKASHRAFLLNSRRMETGRMYVRRASCRPEPWQVAEALYPADDADDALVREVRSALLPKLAFEWGEEVDDDELADALEAYEESYGPIVVILPPPPPDDELLVALRTAFPTLIFLFLAGNDDPSSLQLDGATTLIPLLDPKEERECHRRYRLLCKGAPNDSIGGKGSLAQ
jgi:hypothetical protein